MGTGSLRLVRVWNGWPGAGRQAAGYGRKGAIPCGFCREERRTGDGCGPDGFRAFLRELLNVPLPVRRECGCPGRVRGGRMPGLQRSRSGRTYKNMAEKRCRTFDVGDALRSVLSPIRT